MRRKRLILISVSAVVLVLMVIIAWLASSLDERVRQAFEQRAAAKMGVPVEVGSVNLSLLGGTLHVDDLRIGNPDGYQADHFLTADQIDADFSLGSLFGSTFEMGEVEITGVQAELENRRGRFNYQRILERLGAPSGDSVESSGQGRMLTIGRVRVRSVRSNLSITESGFRLPALQVEIPEIVLENLGSEEGNRMALVEAMRQVIRAISQELVQQGAGASSGGWKQLLRSFTESPDRPPQASQPPKDLEETVDRLKDIFKKP